MKANNVLDYVNWRGDLPFNQCPVNDIDLLVFSLLVYSPFEKINSSLYGKTLFELKDYVLSEVSPAQKLFDNMSVRTASLYSDELKSIWRMMNVRKRFADVTLDYFESSTDIAEEKQFAAAIFGIGRTAVVAFRGTDSSIVGWKEDFNMSLEKPVPAQLSSVKLMDGISRRYRNIYVCGHSKGGNLAMYSSAFCNRRKGKHITDVVSFDGPGLSDSVLKSPEWKASESKIRLYVPESSVVGLLFGSSKEYRVVESDSVSILQHNPFNWHILGADFVYCERVTNSSKSINTRVQDFLKKCPIEQRRVLVNTIFDVLNATGAEHTGDLIKGFASHLPAVRRTIASISENDRAALKEIMNIIRGKQNEHQTLLQ